MVGGGMRLWIHKVKGVVHRQVLVSHVANGVIGGPQVRHDGGTRQNVLLQYWEQRRRIPLWNSHKEAVLGLHVDSSKHPLGVHHPANIGLPPDECRLVNLHGVARATYLQRMSDKVLRENVPDIVPPVHDGFRSHSALTHQRCSGCPLICVQVQQVQHLLQLQLGVGSKEAPIPDRHLLLAITIVASPPTSVLPLTVSNLVATISTNITWHVCCQQSMLPQPCNGILHRGRSNVQLSKIQIRDILRKISSSCNRANKTPKEIGVNEKQSKVVCRS